MEVIGTTSDQTERFEQFIVHASPELGGQSLSVGTVMNMNFQRPETIQAQLAQYDPRAKPPTLKRPTRTRRPRRLKSLVWAIGGGAALYLLASANLLLLLIVGAVAVGLLAVATAVCVYALDNSPW